MKKNLFITNFFLTMFTITVTAQDYQWAKSFGGSNRDYATKIVLDASANVYVTGEFRGTVDFDPSSATANLTSTGDADVFIAKYDTFGNYLWSKSVGGKYNDLGSSIALDNSGNVYITGYFRGTVDFDPSEKTANLDSLGSNDIFFAKYDNNGNYLWAKNVGGSSADYSWSMVLDAKGNVYLTGSYEGTADFDPSASTANLNGSGMYFSKYDTNGNYYWAKSISSNNSNAYSISLDNSGNIYLSGSFEGTADFDPSNSTASLTSTGGEDVFIAKYDTDGNYLWATKAGGPSGDFSLSMAIDISGDIFIIGSFQETLEFDRKSSNYNLISGGSVDIFFAKYDSNGNCTWAKSFVGSSFDEGISLALDDMGNIYMTGTFSNTIDFDPSGSNANLISKGSSDIFFAKYDSNGNYLWAKSIGGASQERGISICLDASKNVYILGYFNGIADFDPSATIVNLTSNGVEDIFISKFSERTSLFKE